MNTEHYIEHENLSVAWSRALITASARGRKEFGPLCVSVTGFDQSGRFYEEPSIRHALDAVLKAEGMQRVETVASTIFPNSMWNPAAPRSELFRRYLSIVPKLKRASTKNKRGLYFERMLEGGPKDRENQLDFALTTFTSRPGVRRSILQIGIFNPALDHSASALLGFPCLQHVTFAPTAEGLCVNALYANQYLVERAYGNYVGLCWLGRFLAHELEVPLARVTCFAGMAECDVGKGILEPIIAAAAQVKGAAA
jgi:hypothetical protein